MRLATFIMPLRRAAALLIAAALASPASAVVIATGADDPNLVAPGNDPGWNNVGHIAGASGVYLGNRWVITANHVSNGALRLSDGREFAVSVGSPLRLENTGSGIGSPDLRMFRLAEDPGLPALKIADAVPAISSRVIMIGAGIDRAAPLIGWQTFGLSWTEVPLRSADTVGYSLLSTSEMRWGVNLVSTGSSFGTNQTFGFNTRFDRLGIPFEAQATSGDSGGGTFFLRDGVWELAGIMTSTQLLGGQPDDTVVFGDQTIIADLSVYRSQILELIEREEPLWQNQTNHFDVSGSSGVTSRDLLLIINELLSAGMHELQGAPGESDGFFDVNGDYRLTVSDAQQVINGLLGGTANPTASPTAGVNFVPEPSGAALALAGLLLVILFRCTLCRRLPATTLESAR